jgi:mono/diheme cytochrome c family protein
MTLKLKIFATLILGLGLAGCERGPTSIASGASNDEALVERHLDAAQVARGKAVYDKNCLECHGASGKGQPGDWRIKDADGHFPPPPLDDSAHAWHHPTAVLLDIIRTGSPQGDGKMPAWQGKLSAQDMDDVVAYIKSLWSDEVYRLWWKMEQQSLEP